MAGLTIDADFGDRAAWDAYVSHSPDGHVCQTWAWGELQRTLRGTPHRIAALDGRQIVGAVQLLVLPLPTRVFAYVPRGPVAAPDDVALVSALVDAMRRVCQAHGANLLRIEPQWPDDAATVGALESLGFAAAHQRIMPPRTMLVDLARSPEAIWKSFHSNARNRVRLALKRGVDVRAGTADDVTTFARLMTDTVRRHGLAIDPSQQSVAAARVFPSDAMRVFIARAAGADIAGIFALACGATTTYLWGATASADEARRVHPNQLLQWTAMQWARDRGCAIYDLFGIPDHDAAQLEAEYPHRNDGMWNLYRFKRGFGGRVHRHVGTFDCRLPA